MPKILMILVVLVAFWPHGSRAQSCLSSGAPIQKMAPGVYTVPYSVTPPSDPRVYDMRDTTRRIAFLGSAKAITLRNRTNGQCIVGPRVVGTQSTTASWSDVKNSNCVVFSYGNQISIGRVTLEGAYLDNCGDALEPMKDFGSMGDGYSWSLRHSYFRGTRDDAIENDACHPGEVIDVLMDRSFAFISSRPGSGKSGSTGSTAPVITVRDSLIQVSNGLFKWPTGQSNCTPQPRLQMSNTILRVDGGARAQLDFPAGTYSNVRVVWTRSGNYPGRLPASGVTVTKDVAVWNSARSSWLSSHGCDSSGNACSRLLP
jgi:hypothetical protein